MMLKTESDVQKNYVRLALEHYHETALRSDKVLNFIEGLGIEEPWLWAQERQVGYCDRSMPLVLPHRDSARGMAIRGALKRNGLINPSSGHERFRGCVLLPMFDIDGRLINVYAERIAHYIRDEIRRSLWLYQNPAWYNLNQETGNTVILCESPFDVEASGEPSAICVMGEFIVTDVLASELYLMGVRHLRCSPGQLCSSELQALSNYRIEVSSDVYDIAFSSTCMGTSKEVTLHA